ncbi:ankyrin repeat domain-containing protein [Nitrospira sp. CMX1]
MRGSHSKMGVSALAFSYFLLWIGVDMACAQVAAQEPDSDTQLIVMITGKLGSEQTFGAGIIFGREKNRLYIVTANHVVRKGQEEARDLQVRLKSLPQKLLKANLLKQVDSELDLAVLSVEGTTTDEIDLCALRMDRLGQTNVKRGDAVYPVGNPNGMPWVMPAVPDRVAQVVGDQVMVQSTVISVGHSGGALLDESSNIIGMITADQPPFGRVAKIDAILKIVQRWGYPVQLRVQLAKGWMPLHEAAYHGDATAIKNLLADTCRVDVNARTDHGSTPLHYATKHVDIIPILLSAGADLHATDQDGDSPLNWAAESGQLKSAELLIKAGTRIDTKNKNQMTALHWAIQNGHPSIARVLVLAGADVNAVTKYPVGAFPGNYTPLEKAMEKGAVEVVEILLKAGANVNVISEISFSPLHSAARFGQVKVLRLLLEAGAAVNVTVGGKWTPLHSAAESNTVEGVKLLLAAGADINAKNYLNETPLHIAVQENALEVVKLLVAAGADVNTKGYHDMTPLHIAVDRKAVEIAKVLIAARASLNEKVYFGSTPLSFAVSHNNAELVSALIAAGADINVVRTDSGETLLEMSPNPEISRSLLEAGADANFGEGLSSGTVLHSAVRRGRVDQVRILIMKGARLDSTDHSHRTPLHYAVGGEAFGKPIDMIEIVKLLLDKGANVNAADSGGRIPLHDVVVSAKNVAATVRLLIEAKAEINAKDTRGDTPLHDLAGRRFTDEKENTAGNEIAELLIMNGADINATNNNSKTPLAIAIENENITLTRLLRSRGAKE